MRLESSREAFDAYCSTAAGYWRTNTLPAGDDVVLVEALHCEFRVALRNLTVANALRRIVPARLVLVTGTDRWWLDAIWETFDVELFRQLGIAFGAEVLDVHAMVDDEIRTGHAADLGDIARVGGRDGQPNPDLSRMVIDANVDATVCRVLKVPRVTDVVRQHPDFPAIQQRTEVFAGLYARLVAALRPVAFVTSHIDYNHWGLASDAARQAQVPIVHVQQYGGLKAYASFPDHDTHAGPIRAGLTNQIAQTFEARVWSRRDRLRESAELVAWRSKENLGRPIWWRRGPSASVEIRNPTERRQLREIAMKRLGLDATKPVITVFNHAVSDAIGANVEAFGDLADWFEQTVAFAAAETRVNWLMLDHPQQKLYDATDFVGGLGRRYKDARQIHFGNSLEISKNLLWSLTDLGVTVRGSISNELPAYGIPVIQAGWSEWSGCGLTQVAGDQATYWKLLEADIAALLDGREIVTAEQVERARLWLWFYRTATDVTSPLVPHWLEGAGDEVLRTSRIRMEHIESDGDPAFVAVHRMWTRQEPILSRFDLGDDAAIAGAVPPR